MSQFLCRYADPQGRVHEEVESAESEEELRQRLSDRGFLIYSVKPRRSIGEWKLDNVRPAGRKLPLEQLLIFNQQFVTLTRAGLPILKGLDLLVGNIKNRRLRTHLQSVHAKVKTGMPLSEAFQSEGVFPPIYTTSIMAGEKSGSLPEVIERYVAYQKVALGARKKILVSLIYPAVLVFLVFILILFLVTYVVPEFASLYESMDAQLPYMTQLLVAFGVTANENLWLIALVVFGVGSSLAWWFRSDRIRDSLDGFKLKVPVFGQIWIKYQVSQLCRLLGTLLQGGIPLLQALETTGASLGSRLLRESIAQSREMVREGQPLSRGLAAAGIFPSLAVEMVNVGESTGSLPAMLHSVAEFFDDDVNTMMSAALSLIEPAIMIFMGIFVAFVLISLYLPIFTLAETL
ncbi:MAG: type II secretion system F family protein [Bryobacterales bacterium]|nr:type II secretion system F family protein [Bryobacterales bacterium]MDE0294560.1 type II secretion system F family protein [Bryobacterales bacterium]